MSDTRSDKAKVYNYYVIKNDRFEFLTFFKLSSISNRASVRIVMNSY